MDVIVSALVSVVISGLVSGAALFLNHYWQQRQEVRVEGLKHFRALKTYGFLTLAGDKKWLDDRDQLEKVRQVLAGVGTAIYELDLIASPKVLTHLVNLLRETNNFTDELQRLAQAGKKISPSELEQLKDALRHTLVELFYAMRTDAGRSNKGLKYDDILYLLSVDFGTSKAAGQSDSFESAQNR